MSNRFTNILKVTKNVAEAVGEAQTALTRFGSLFRPDDADPENLVPLISKVAINDLRDTLQAAVVQPLQQTFPGLSLETIKQGRIPVATSLLEKHLQALVGSQDGLEALSLGSQTGRFLLNLTIATRGVKSNITLPLTCMDFAYGKEARAATFVFQEASAQAKGLNVLGRVLGQIPALILVKALRSPDFMQELKRASEGMAQLDWPNVRIDLDKCDELRPIRDFATSFPDLGLWRKVLPKPLQELHGQQVGLLDLFSFGPLEIDQDRVWVRVTPLI